jgi:tRNA(fMet)-specific endonuclease VapC
LPHEEVLAVSVHAVCELMAGALSSRAPAAELERVSRLCDALIVQYPDQRFAGVYGRLLAHVHPSGSPLPTMDLLIGTAAVLDDAPLVTRNGRHFSRIPGLTVESY